MQLAGGNKSEKVALLSLGDLDGRTLAAKQARQLIDDLESDLGGRDRLSAAERELIQRAALAGAMLQDLETRYLMGRGIDVAAYSTLANAQRRLLATVGLKRRPRDVTPDLSAYIAEHGQGGDAQEASDGE